MNSWWETPLNYKFLNEIGNKINEGNIVLAFLPKHAPKNFLSQFKVIFDIDRNLFFEKINLNECDIRNSKPVESLLFTHFEIENNANNFIQKSAASIFKYLESLEEEDPQIEDNKSIDFFVFENLANNILEHFRDFIVDLGHYLSSLQVYKRPKIMVIIDPLNFKPSDFTSETGVSKILFQGTFDKLDYSLGLRYYHRYQADVFTSLNESIITSLSLFDSGLIEELVDCDNLIDEYEDVLIQYAKDKEWDKIKYKNIDDLKQNETWNLWVKGILDIKNDKIIYHSAFLKIHNKESELTRRVWSAGIEVLLPLIEELRGEILNCNNIIFPEFFKTKDGDKIKKMDLEIGEINHFIKIKKIYPKYFTPSDRQKIIKYIDTSCDIRNYLSHLRIPKTQDIKLFLKEYDTIIKLLKNTN